MNAELRVCPLICALVCFARLWPPASAGMTDSIDSTVQVWPLQSISVNLTSTLWSVFHYCKVGRDLKGFPPPFDDFRFGRFAIGLDLDYLCSGVQAYKHTFRSVTTFCNPILTPTFAGGGGGGNGLSFVAKSVFRPRRPRPRSDEAFREYSISEHRELRVSSCMYTCEHADAPLIGLTKKARGQLKLAC